MTPDLLALLLAQASYGAFFLRPPFLLLNCASLCFLWMMVLGFCCSMCHGWLVVCGWSVSEKQRLEGSSVFALWDCPCAVGLSLCYGSSSGCQASWQALVSAEPSLQYVMYFFQSKTKPFFISEMFSQLGLLSSYCVSLFHSDSPAAQQMNLLLLIFPYPNYGR